MTGQRVPATAFADAAWTARRLTGLVGWYRTDDRRVLATLWWYSASAVLLDPALSGLATGRPVSGRLADASVEMSPLGLPTAATASALGDDLGGELRASLTAAIDAVSAAGGLRPRPLWAIATDSIATRLLAHGRAGGDAARVTALAGPLARDIGPPLPAPRYVDVGAVRFVRRVSCCLLYRAPGQSMCTSCPRRPPAERQVLLRALSGG